MKERYLILRIVAKQLIPFIIMFAFYVQFHGEDGPGGGFQAGVIFAAGIILYGLVFGIATARKVLLMRVLTTLAPLGVLLYAGVGVATMLAGGNFLEYGALDHHDPAHGNHLGILLIELGVGLTVGAVMMVIFFTFSERRD